MSKPELTKRLMAQTLKELMMSTNLDKISVQDIVKRCGLNRKTFYYHFQDKQALICWIFDMEFSSLTDRNHDNTIIDELIQHLYANKEFYVAALTSNVQNNLREHLFKVVYNGIMSKIKTILKSNKIPPDDIKMIANYFSNAIMGSITQWVKEGMKTPPDEYITDFHPITQECLEFAIKKVLEKRGIVDDSL